MTERRRVTFNAAAKEQQGTRPIDKDESYNAFFGSSSSSSSSNSNTKTKKKSEMTRMSRKSKAASTMRQQTKIYREEEEDYPESEGEEAATTTRDPTRNTTTRNRRPSTTDLSSIVHSATVSDGYTVTQDGQPMGAAGDVIPIATKEAKSGGGCEVNQTLSHTVLVQRGQDLCGNICEKYYEIVPRKVQKPKCEILIFDQILQREGCAPISLSRFALIPAETMKEYEATVGEDGAIDIVEEASVSQQCKVRSNDEYGDRAHPAKAQSRRGEYDGQDPEWGERCGQWEDRARGTNHTTAAGPSNWGPQGGAGGGYGNGPQDPRADCFAQLCQNQKIGLLSPEERARLLQQACANYGAPQYYPPQQYPPQQYPPQQYQPMYPNQPMYHNQPNYVNYPPPPPPGHSQHSYVQQFPYSNTAVNSGLHMAPSTIPIRSTSYASSMPGSASYHPGEQPYESQPQISPHSRLALGFFTSQTTTTPEQYQSHMQSTGPPSEHTLPDSSSIPELSSQHLPKPSSALGMAMAGQPSTIQPSTIHPSTLQPSTIQHVESEDEIHVNEPHLKKSAKKPWPSAPQPGSNNNPHQVEEEEEYDYGKNYTIVPLPKPGAMSKKKPVPAKCQVLKQQADMATAGLQNVHSEMRKLNRAHGAVTKKFPRKQA